jgi:hypothetical protein
MMDVVVVYSEEDEALAAPIVESARSFGVTVETAPQREPEAMSAEAIETQIEEAGALLVCWSPHAVASSGARMRAAIASAHGKLAACRVAPCAIPFPFDALATVDLEHFTGGIEAPEFAALVETIGEKLRRPGLSVLLRARLSGDAESLAAFMIRFPDEPEAKRLWSEREARYREECAAMLADARRHLEQRAASEQAKIETTLATFARDFDNWLERERRGESAPKPSLNTLFEIWLERGGRRGEASKEDGAAADETLKRRAEAAEERARDLQEQLAAETARAEELEQRLEDAEWRARQPSRQLTLTPLIVDHAPQPQRARRERRRIWPKLLATAAVLAVAVFAAASYWPGEQPQQLREALARIKEASAGLETQGRRILDALAVGFEEARGALRADAGDAMRTAAIEGPPPAPAAPPEPSPQAAEGQASSPSSPESLASTPAGANAPEQGEPPSTVADAPPPELQTRATLEPPHPDAVAPEPAATQPPAAEPLQQIVMTPPQEAPAPTPAPQKRVAYRAYDNREIAGGQMAKLNIRDLPACAAACRGKTSCKGYTFDKWNRVCFLKSSVAEFRLNPRSSSGVRDDVRIPRAPSGAIRMERYPSKAFPGVGYKSVEAGGPDECEDACRLEDACVAFTFRLDEGACHLFRSTGEYFSNQLADSGGKRQ